MENSNPAAVRKVPEANDKQVTLIVSSHKFFSKGVKYASGDKFICGERQAARLVGRKVAIYAVDPNAGKGKEDAVKDASNEDVKKAVAPKK